MWVFMHLGPLKMHITATEGLVENEESNLAPRLKNNSQVKGFSWKS